ncbi:hypothetical protein JCM6882_009573 [Rhodosporidiobolus microsporus]
MPPKKKQKTQATIHSDLLHAISSSSPSSLSSDRLSADLLARAYGLAPPQKGSSSHDTFNRRCSNSWEHAHEPHKVVVASSSSGKGKAKADSDDATEVIVIDSADEDPVPSTSKAKGKGKGRAQDEDPKPKPCSHAECDRNPLCLNWLGQEKWETDKSALKDFRKASGLTYDPQNDREEDVPVGLQNLGATCYANSFLQVWYRDTRFRNGVYSCQPSSNGNVCDQPIFQLQVLFAALQASIQGVYDPTPLIASLKLDTSEQQDAQEFSKLFLQVLDREFKAQGKRAEQEGADGSVARLVEEMFEGKLSYATRCETCKTESGRSSSFLELEVNLAANCKLEDRIKESLKSERLVGDNQYFCEPCDAKSDALRITRLDSLPPVLHFSLIRFAWDPKDFSRYKSQHAISYPLQLDMGQFLPPNPATRKPVEMWYDLKGVLMHKGTSAHSGHYVAQVLDESLGKWFLFDDETVTPIDDLNAPTVHDEDGDPVKSKKRPATGFTRDAKGAILPKSKDAYMLVYIRRDSSPSSSPSPSSSRDTSAAAPVPPPLAQAEVEKIDEKYVKEVEEFKAKSAGIEDEFNKARDQKRSVYRVWQVDDEAEEAFMVDKNSLRAWLLDGLKKPKTKKQLKEEADTKKDTTAPSSDVEILDAPPKSEAPSSAAPDVDMADGTNGTSIVPDSTAPSPSASTSAEPKPDDADDNLPDPTKLFVKRGSLSLSSKEPEPMKTIDNTAVVCEHGMLNPKKAESLKRVSQMGIMALRDLGVSIEPELMTPSGLCRECVAGIAADHIYDQKHPDDTAAFDQADRGAVREDFLSKEWLRDWRKKTPKMHQPGTINDPSPGDEPWLRDVECEHGGLQPDAKRRVLITKEAVKVLKKIFKGWSPTTANSCEICEGTHQRDQEDAEQLKGVHAKEKKLLKPIDDMMQSRLVGSRLPLSADEDAHYAVPKDWCRLWFNWSRQKAGGPKARPPKIGNSQYLCKHGLLCLDLSREAESPKTIEVVPKSNWKYLVQAYGASPPIRIWQEPYLDAPSSNPEVCEGCLAEHLKSFDTAELQIKTLSADDFDKDGNRRAGTSSAPSPVDENPRAPPTTHGSLVTYGSRASSRIKGKSGLTFRKEAKYIQMAKDDQVKDLKLKIEESTKIPVIAQRLFLHFQELQDSSISVAELGLKTGDTLEVFGVDTDNVDLTKLEDEAPKRKGKRGRSEGFGGTGLLGWEDFVGEGGGERSQNGIEVEENGANGSTNGSNGGAHASSSSSTTMAAMMEDEDGRITCQTCTFSNAPGMTTCEMCESSLAG